MAFTYIICCFAVSKHVVYPYTSSKLSHFIEGEASKSQFSFVQVNKISVTSFLISGNSKIKMKGKYWAICHYT